MFMHMFVLLDKTFTDVIPYESMWELDMRIAYRDATAVVVLLLLLLLLFDTVKRKFPKTKAAFEFVGIK